MNVIAALILPMLLAFQEPSPSVEQLIERLHSSNIDERNRAVRQLALREGESLPALEKASRDPDPEVSARARALLETIPPLQKLTPALKRVLPTLQERLASGTPHAWTVAFLDATKQDDSRRAHPELGRDDFQALAARALRFAEAGERAGVCGVIAAWRLDAAIPELSALLDEKDWNLWEPLLDAIVACRATSLVPALLERLRREQKEQKAVWAQPLIGLGSREAVPDLLTVLRTIGWMERGQFLYSVAGMDAPELTPELVKVLREQGADPYCALLALASQAPEEILPTLEKSLGDDQEHLRQYARDVLTTRYRSPDSIPFLTRFLSNPDANLRGMAVTCLGALRTEGALPEIRARLEDDAVTVRRSAARVLASYGIKDGLPELLAQLRIPEARIGTAYSLWQVGSREGIPVVQELLQDPKQANFAAEVLAQMGVAEARPAILKMLESSDSQARRSAMWSLAVLDGAKAAPTLKRQLNDADEGHYALSMIRDLGLKDVLPEALAFARRGTGTEADIALSYLCRFAPAEALPLALKRAESPQLWERSTACYRLSTIGGPEAVAKIRVLLTDHSRHVREAAAESMALLGEKEGLSLILYPWQATRNHLSLNAARRPELCRAWRGRVLSGPPLTGNPREIAAQLSKRIGIPVEWPRDGSDLTNHYDRWIRVEGRDLLSVLFEALQECANAVFEEDRIRIQGRREARDFWRRWWAEDRIKSGSPEEQAEGRASLAELEESQRRSAEWKDLSKAAEAGRAQEVRSLSPAVRAIPGIEDRLNRGSDETWIQVLTELACLHLHNKDYQELTADDLTPIALRALRAAVVPDDRVKVLQCVSNKKLRGAAPVLRPLLKDGDPNVRATAAAALLRIEGVRALAAVDPLLEDADANVRRNVAAQICMERLSPAAMRLRSLFQDGAIRDAIAFNGQALEFPETAEFLLEYLERGYEYLAKLPALYRITSVVGPEHNGRVINLLRKEKDPQCREQLLRHLGYIGGREAVPDIIALIDNPGQFLPEHFLPRAMEALGQLGGPEAEAAILNRVRRDPPDFKAIEIAAQMGLKDAVPTLRKILNSDAPTAVSMIDPLVVLNDRESIPRMRKFLSHDDLGVRSLAAKGLAKIGDEESFPRLLEIARERQSPEKYVPGHDPVLILLYLPPEIARRDLAGWVGKSSNGHAAAWARIGGEEFVPLLLSRLKLDEMDRYWETNVLGRIGGEPATQGIRELLTAKNQYLRSTATSMLCRNGLRDALPLIFSTESVQGYGFPYLELNAVRSPKIWKRLGERALKQPVYGTAKELVTMIANEAGLSVEVPPAGSPVLATWENYHLRLQEWGRPLSLLEALERLQHSRWAFVLEGDRIHVMSPVDARKFWIDWWAKEKK
jgi:HEAT repeat protein